MTDSPTPPSARRLLVGTLVAVALAAIVLVAAVLPAEYGVDPLGIGDRLGLVVLSDPSATDIPVRADGITAQPEGFLIDRREFSIPPEEGMEYKFRLEAGEAMVYSWTASGPVRSEMHSERDGAPEGTAEFFEVEESTTERHGTYVAPFPGDHGWYWENLSANTLTVVILAAGYFDDSIEYPPSGDPILREIITAPGSDFASPPEAATSDGTVEGDQE